VQATALVAYDGAGDVRLEALTVPPPGPGQVRVRVRASALNYKDALALTGKGRVLRKLPLVPGIDLAGEVEASGSPRFPVGQAVLATGTNLGEVVHGGLSTHVLLEEAQVVPAPPGWTPLAAMAAGTAGLTAMLAVQELDAGGVPAGAEVVVTGAGGGVGTFGLLLARAAGYAPVASTGRPELESSLLALGAARVIPRAQLARPTRALEAEAWAGAIDSVGGETLAALLAQARRHGVVCACGLVGGAELKTTVMPFILRGVSLRGIDSNECEPEVRARAWERLAREVPLQVLESLATTVPLARAREVAPEVLAGRTRRVVVLLP
jgi:acrylyl-CoA reductase (NADPH)